ncbi:hypothetical protein SAMN02745163_00055 [Clostridium cavendishii DSM 21758]|uniref:Uncharacterized protein n=1 Tax=Clostridium cavendishii DSM 21758 TaxID=1121302 RepID=A0A1M6ADA3_9CLOT|nr:hypothetical protein [Clostridium cavendishii]SHI34520.1 hypothetical protein SAMN02745163_00055 [Clostridium cavendishii DSM 21758]
MYVAFGNRIIDSKDMKAEIEENSEFNVVKDMTKGSKRDDMLAFNLSISIDVLDRIMKEDYDEGDIDIDNLTEDELFDEYISLAEEVASDLEEIVPEEGILDIRAYKWDTSDNDIKLVIAMTHEEIGENKLRDVMKRLITQVE